MSTTTIWLLTATSVPLLWAVSNVLDAAIRRHFIKDDAGATWLMGLMDLPFLIFFLWLGGLEFPDFFTTIMIFIAGMSWVFPEMLYFKAIKNEDPSRIALLIQLVPLTTLIMAMFFLGERLSGFQFMAFLVLILGGTIAAFKKIKGIWYLSKAFGLIAVASLLWSFSDVFFKKYEVNFVSFEAAFSVYFLSSFIGSFLLFLYSNRKRKKVKLKLDRIPLRGWFMMSTTVVAGNVGALAFAYALTLKEASLTSVIMGVQPLAVIFFGFLFSKFMKEVKAEKLNKEAIFLKIIAFIFIMIGIALLQLS